MLKVWGRRNSINVQKVMWAVGELGLSHERIDAGGPFGGLDSETFRAMNPHGLVPVVQDEGVTVWESNAAIRYLASRYGADGLYCVLPRDRALADAWMDWMLTTLYPDFIRVFWGLSGPRRPGVITMRLAVPPSAWDRACGPMTAASTEVCILSATG